MITGFGAALAAGWLLVAVSGGAVVGTIRISPLAGAVACGATALALTVRPRPGAAGLLEAPVLVVGLPLAAALGVGNHTALPLVAVVVLCLMSASTRWRHVRWAVVVGWAGATAVTGGLVLSLGDLRAGVLAVEGTGAAALLAVGAAGLVAAAGLAPEREEVLRTLVLPGLAIAWVVGPLVDGVALAAAALAAASLVAARHRPVACAFASAALAAVPAARPAAALLGAGAVLVVALGPSLAWPAVLPGAVAAALGLAAGPAGVDTVAAGVAVILAVAGLATVVGSRVVLGPRALPAVVLAGWLAVAPATWTWGGQARVEHYQQGASRALAAALLVTVVAWMTGQLRPPAPEWRSDGW